MYKDDFERIEAVFPNGSHTATARKVQQLDKKDFNRLQYAARSVKRLMKLLDETIVEEKLNREVDYEKMVKNAKKRFNDIDISILQLLLGSELSYYTRGIRASMAEEDLKYNEKEVLKRCRRLKRLGLIQLDRGLFDDDDGTIAGSGWSISFKRQKIAQRIVDTVQGVDNQQSLMEEL